MGILRMAAAVGALVWIAPHLPRTVVQNLPEWKDEAVAAAGQIVASDTGKVLASQAVALCGQNPERCASLLSATAPIVAPSAKPQPSHAEKHPPKTVVEAENVRRPRHSAPAP